MLSKGAFGVRDQKIVAAIRYGIDAVEPLPQSRVLGMQRPDNPLEFLYDFPTATEPAADKEYCVGKCQYAADRRYKFLYVRQANPQKLEYHRLKYSTQ